MDRNIIKSTKAIASILILLLLVSCSNAQEAETSTTTESKDVTQQKTKFEDVNAETFKVLVESNNGIILDVRTTSEIAYGRIKGAIHMDYHASDFTDQVSKLDQTKPICVYCASGGRSRGAMEKMKSLGFSEVYNLMGGFRAWQASGFSIENK